MNEHETIADIIAEMRGADNKCQLATKDGTGCYHCPFGSAASNCVFDNYADRLEAAHRRERGNAAKLREALVKCRDIALQWQADEAAGVAGTTDKPHARSAAEAVVDMEFEINAALAAPPRNCDRFATADEAIGAYRQTHKHMVVNVFLDWLLAPATEKEGGAK